MTKTVDLTEIKTKLIQKLTASGWAVKLRGFVQSSDFDKILENLLKERDEGKRFTPPLKYTFRAFEECPLKDLKVVIIGQDPYPYFGVADGLAFSCGLTGNPQPSLKNIFDALYPDLPFDDDADLTRWANQGVLLLNTALTTQVDKVGTHYEIWKDFIAYVLDMLSLTNSGLIFMLLGPKAQELESLIGQHHYILKASHPASAAYSKTTWDCNDVFNKANKILEKNNGSQYKILW